MGMAAIPDVIVVGAGLTGLKAALDLQAKGLNVKVLEGRTRVGGRAHSVTQTYNGKPTVFDFGAHFIGDDDYQSSIWDLVKSLGLTTFEQYDGPGSTGPQPLWNGQGANIQENAGGGFDAYIGNTVPTETGDQFYLQYMQSMVSAVPLEAPWTIPTAKKLDSLSVEDWVTSVNVPEYGPPSDYFKGLVRMLCRVGFSCEARDISMLWLLFYIGSSGGLSRFQAIRWPLQGAQGYRMAEGAQSIAEGIVAKLTQGTVLTNVTIATCTNTPGQTVTLTDTNGHQYTARVVLFAMSPLLYSQIKFSTPLPTARTQAAAAMANSNMFMTFVRFDKAFWRKDTTSYPSGTVNGVPVYPTNPDPLYQGNVSQYGLSGDVLLIDGPTCWMMDNASYEGAPALFAFIVGDEAVKARQMTPAQRQAMIIKRMTDVFGPNVGNNNPQYNEMDWNSEALSMGCPAGHFGKGSFATYGQEILLSGNGRNAVDGNLFFASTETSTISNGYMDGAVWSGTQIALAIADTIAGTPPAIADNFEREAAMRFCVTTILSAIAAQNPMMEWPAIDDNMVFHGPGGQALGGDFSGKMGTIDFYTLLGMYFTIGSFNVESVVTDVAANRAYAWWSASGKSNANGGAFRDVKGTMIFRFSQPGVMPCVVVEEWLLMDSPMIDALALGPPPTVPDPAAQLIAAATQAGDLSWLPGAVANGGLVWGPGGAVIPEGPYIGTSQVNALPSAFSTLPNYKLVLKGSRSDPERLGGVILYELSGTSSGVPYTQPLTASLWFGSDAGNPLREIRLQTDSSKF